MVAVAYLLLAPLVCASASSSLPSLALPRHRATSLRSLRRSLWFAFTYLSSPPHGDQSHGSSLARYTLSKSVPRRCLSQRRPTGFGTGLSLMPVSLIFARSGRFLSNMVAPYLVDSGPGNANLGTKVFYIWASMCFMCIIFAYFCIPETKGLSLEQVDLLYQNVVPVHSVSYRKRLLAEGTELTEATGRDAPAVTKDEYRASSEKV